MTTGKSGERVVDLSTTPTAEDVAALLVAIAAVAATVEAAGVAAAAAQGTADAAKITADAAEADAAVADGKATAAGITAAAGVMAAATADAKAVVADGKAVTAQDTADTGIANAAIAQAGADASAKIASAGADYLDPMAFLVNVGAQVSNLRAAVPGQWVILSGAPSENVQATTASIVVNQYRWFGVTLREPLPFDRLAVDVTTAPGAGTCTMVFGLWSLNANNIPGALLVDLSVYAIDLSGGPGPKYSGILVGALPTGRHFLGCQWFGTAATPPSLRTMVGADPRVSGVIPSSSQTATVQTVVGMPNPAVPTPGAGTTSGPLVWYRRPA